MTAIALENPTLVERAPFAGVWINSNQRSAFTRVDVVRDGGGLLIEPYDPEPWGPVRAEVFASDLRFHTEAAMSAAFALEGRDVRLQVRLNTGVLVVAYFTRFRDGSDRSPFYVREFYCRRQP